MYVNRKKRSVKWIHDNGGVEEQSSYEGITKRLIILKPRYDETMLGLSHTSCFFIYAISRMIFYL
jgi:hypothetical protein